jgi:hypothetical protein
MCLAELEWLQATAEEWNDHVSWNDLLLHPRSGSEYHRDSLASSLAPYASDPVAGNSDNSDTRVHDALLPQL